MSMKSRSAKDIATRQSSVISTPLRCCMLPMNAQPRIFRTSLRASRCGAVRRSRRFQWIRRSGWPAYISAAQAVMPQAEQKICFDKFHVAQHLSKAVDMVRRREHRSLLKRGKTTLKKTKYLWLGNPDTMSDQLYAELEQLSRLRLKTARAWSLKECAMYLWKYVSRHWGRTGWTLGITKRSVRA